MKHNRKFSFFSVLLLFVLACNVFKPGQPKAVPSQPKPIATTAVAVEPTGFLATLTPALFSTPTKEIYVAPDQSGFDIACDGVRTDPPCEPRKIRIRGYDNPTCDGGQPQPGESYGWFPLTEGIPWIIVTHGLPGEPNMPKGWALDAGTLLTFVKAEGGYWFVINPDDPSTNWTLNQSEVGCASKPSASYFMKSISAPWCPVNPNDGTSTLITVGETYTWFGLGYKVQFNFAERYKNADAIIAAGRDPDIIFDRGEFVPVQDFEPMQFLTTSPNRGSWVISNGELLYLGNGFCNYWEDTFQ